jgi:putative peptidoglycan lipid II flippase
LAIIGASYSIAAFPLLANLYAQKKMDAFALHINTALRHIIFWSVPVIGLVVVLRAQMVRVVLGSGAFDWGDTRLTAAVLAILCISLFAQAINLLMVRVFYAGGFTKIPFLVTLFGSVTAVTLSLVFYGGYASSTLHPLLESLMRIDGVPGAEVLTLALGYSIAIILQTIVLLAIAIGKFGLDSSWLPMHASRSVAAAVVGGFCAYTALNFFIFGIDEETFIGIFLQGLMGGIAGILGIISTYYITGSPELQEIYKSFRGRVTRSAVVVPQDDIL